LSKDEQEKVNDDLLYDPDEEEEDEKWMTNQRLKYTYLFLSYFHLEIFLFFRSRGANNPQKSDTSSLGPTDAVLNCPGCMVLVCHDCQRYFKNIFTILSNILFV